MKLKLKDGKVLELENAQDGLSIAKAIAVSLAKKAIAIKVDGELEDLSTVIDHDAEIEIITKESPEAFQILNHSAAHVLAQAIMRLYRDAQLEYGPSIEEGFFYDIGFSSPVSEADFAKIEKEMSKIADEALPIVREEVSLEKAKELFANQKYKLAHLDEIEGKLTIYRQGEFYDLCRGPHVSNTKYCKHIKLTSISGAYYKGDSKNEQLTRIYGTCFFSAEELENHLKLLEERKQSDHRKLGKELGLFMISDYGPGFPFFLPNGMILRRELENFWYDIHTEEGYVFVKTPIILSRELWETSGHWANYKENMYTTTIDDGIYAIKPMNCPGGMLVYKNEIHSYRDLPIRMGELGLVHRHEASGALNGLFRVRNFTQDDAHIFLRPDQLEDEMNRLLKLFKRIYDTFGLSYKIVLSTRPEDKYIGSIETWDRSEAILEKVLIENGVDYKINPGDGAFYGPKLDFKLKDSMNRIWQCGTIQLDMNLPERFDLTYVDADGEKKRPIMLHRAIYGSLERFIGILIENFKGAFPTWMSPRQVVVLPVSKEENQVRIANEIVSALKKLKIRAEIDDRDEKISYRMRDAQVKKTPYTLVIGAKEVETGNVTYRIFGSKDSFTVSYDEFVKLISSDIAEKKLKRF